MTRLASAAPEAAGAASRVVAGLSSVDAQRRLTDFGPNAIRREQTTAPLALLARQFASPVIWLLLAASVLSAAVGALLDAAAIGAIVIVNAVIGFLIVALVVFLIVRAMQRMQPAPAPAAPTTKDCPYCLSRIPVKASKCAHCTSVLS